MVTAEEIIECLISMADEAKSRQLSKFFKTGKGQYAEGDKFLGLVVPKTRLVVKEARLQVPFSEIQILLYSE